MLGCSAANTNVGMQPGVRGQSPWQALLLYITISYLDTNLCYDLEQ